MAGPNTNLNRSRGETGYKSIPSPNDDHHLEHIFGAHCCVDVWLPWGSLIHRTTHWSYAEVTFWKGGGAKSKFLRRTWQCERGNIQINEQQQPETVARRINPDKLDANGPHTQPFVTERCTEGQKIPAVLPNPTLRVCVCVFDQTSLGKQQRWIG